MATVTEKARAGERDLGWGVRGEGFGLVSAAVPFWRSKICKFYVKASSK